MSEDICTVKHTELDKRLDHQNKEWDKSFLEFKLYCRQELAKTDKKIDDAVILVKDINNVLRSLSNSITTLEVTVQGLKKGQENIATKILYPLVQGVILFLVLKYLK